MQSQSGVIDDIELEPLAQGALDSLAFAVKDVFDLSGRVTGFGSPDWQRTHGPAGASARVIEQLRQAGARLRYVTVSDELAFSLDGLNSHYPLPLNPQSPERICGGSSSGSASVCAAGLVDFALGTDTAGSVRVPAAYCGLYGLRPTHGDISVDGVLPLGKSFDTVGLLARSAKTLRSCAGALLKPSSEAAKKRLLFVEQTLLSMLDSRLGLRGEEAVETFAKFFAQHTYDSLPFEMAQFVHHFGIMRGYEAWQAHGSWWLANKPELLPGTAQRLLACRAVSEAQYQKSCQFYRQVRAELSRFFDDGRVLFLPTVWSYAPLLDASEQDLADNRQRNLLLTALSSFAGLPQLTVPFKIGSDTKYPSTFGFSLIGDYHSDLDLLDIACAMQD